MPLVPIEVRRPSQRRQPVEARPAGYRSCGYRKIAELPDFYRKGDGKVFVLILPGKRRSLIAEIAIATGEELCFRYRCPPWFPIVR
jgi:hypothetical protein